MGEVVTNKSQYRKAYRGYLAKGALHALAMFLLVATAGTQAQYASDTATAHDVTAAVTNVSSPHPVAAPGQSLTQLPDGSWLAIGGSEHPVDLVLEHASGSRIATLSLHLAQGRSGHSATLLPDGTVLVFGGVDSGGRALDSAEVVDLSKMTIQSLAATGLLPRAYHSTSVLSDGRVLVAGGVGKDGTPLLQAEIYDPASHQVEVLDGQLDHARLKHLAAMVGNSSILLWGGSDGDGRILANGSVYNPAAAQFSGVGGDQALLMAQSLSNAVPPAVVETRPAGNTTAVPIGKPLMVHFNKRMAVTSLNADTVTLIGPSSVTPVKVVPVEEGALLFVTPAQELQPAASYTLFINGATDQNGRLLPFTAIGFTTESLSPKTDSSTQAAAKGTNSASTASTPDGVSTKASASAAASSTKVLAPVQGKKSVFGSPAYFWLPKSASDLFSLIDQAHATHESLVASIDASDETWTPGAANYHGKWTSGHGHWGQYHPPANETLGRALYGHPEITGAMAKLRPGTVASGMLKKLVPARALTPERGVTAISGQVLRLNSRPLANVSLSIGNHVVRTDANGEFVLRGVPAGHQVMVIDGGSADEGQRQYGRYEYGIDVVANQVNVLPFVIWMTRLDSANALNIPSPTNSQTVLTNPKIPGLELRIPAGTVIRDAQGKVVTQLSMTAIPTDQPPFPLPNVPVPTYFTIQPGGAHLEGANGHVTKGAQLVYPNFTSSAPGSRITFWNYDSTGKGWYVYGQGTVTADGKQVMPDPGVVIYEFTGAMVSVDGNAPNSGPAEGGSGPGIGSGSGSGSDPDPTNPSPDPKNKPPHCGDPVDCSTGLFLNEETDFRIPDVMPVVLRRSYRPQDSASRAFGVGTNLSYDMFMVGDMNPYTYQDLILPDGGRIHYPRISAGTSWTDAVYQNVSTPGKFYGSVLKWDLSTGYAWTLTLKDGTVYSFADEAGSTSARAGAVRAISDRFGNTLTLTRDGNYNLTQVTSPNGRHLNFIYDSSNRVTQASDDLGRTSAYTYDAIGRLIKVTDPAGYFEQYTYDANSNMLTVTDKRGNLMVTNTYDGNGRVSKQTYADSTTLLFAYTVGGNGKVTQTDITDQRGIVHREIFTSSGYLSSVIRAMGRPEQQTTTYTRDPVTNLLSTTTDALGRVTSYTHDALGNLTQITQLYGTANPVTSNMQYSSQFGLLTQITNANGFVTTMSYDGSGNLVQVQDPLGHLSNYTYDVEGRLLTATDANGNTNSFTYFGGDLVSAIDALGRKMVVRTDAVGRTIGTVNPLGAQYSTAYDSLNRIINSVDPNGSQLQFGFDQNGNRTSHTDANNHVAAYTFDAMNHVVTKTDSLSFSESYGYDPIGHLIRRIDRKQQVSGWTYDGLGRVTQAGFGATVANPTAYTSTISQTWDAGDRLTQVVDSANGTIGRSYDALDRMTQETTVQGTVNYTYDAGGRRTSMTVQGQPTVNYTWDNANRLSQIQQAAGASNGNIAQIVTFQYDNANRRTLTILANGVHVAYAYDAANQLSGITYTQTNGGLIGNLAYGYDLAGHRTSVSGSLANVNLPAAIASGVYNANNQLAQWNGVTYSYDANGNLLNDSSRTYTWNARDQLTSLAGISSASFQYDAVGRRIGKNIGGATTGYLYDGGNFVQEKNGAGATAAITANLLTGGTDETFVRMTSTSINTPLLDAMGSTIAETNTAQAIITNYSYDPYGATTQSGISTGSSQQYAGRENDSTGLYYNRARYYSPAAGRFTQEDPIGWASRQANNYAYVGGNPVTRTDPYGLAPPYMGVIPGYPGMSLDQVAQSAVAQGATNAAQSGNAGGSPCTPGDLGHNIGLGAGAGGILGFGAGVLITANVIGFPEVEVIEAGGTAAGSLAVLLTSLSEPAGSLATGGLVGSMYGATLGGAAGAGLTNPCSCQ
ncbi:RHS repeat-associated core domain-containing protein [Nevskia soli]|uniref:RHS repeat-associated core domain-containing protein n=1 Tax=Nevskia soli TaxID=418856 RepID=UPI0004A74061|nr:RHS repeat-associated core domain-containing protein [Nevskia soli]